MSNIKHISNDTTVDLDDSLCLWDNGLAGDARVELWADTDCEHVWAETNGDPVYGEDELRDLLLAEGMDEDVVDEVITGDMSSLPEYDAD
jgi:hypothetical protein